MKTLSRRVLFYWLLLLLPALLVGAGALWLLHREETHIGERVRATDAARRAAMEARARLIAENIEIVINEVQSGLMDTLNEAPATSPSSFLSEWKRANPLVRDAFHASGVGHLLWGHNSDTTLAWLATAPWRQALASHPVTSSEFSHENALAANTANASQIGIVRQELQEISKLQKRENARFSSTIRKSNPSTVVPLPSETNRSNTEVSSLPNLPSRTNILSTRTGWTPWSDASGQSHLHGWRLCENGTVLVVEINSATLGARLRDLLPQVVEAGENYAIGEIEKKPGRATGHDGSKPAHNLTIPISALPGWAVHGCVVHGGVGPGHARGFFLLSTLLVALFVLAIIVGGSLLMRQARLSEVEAAQKTSFVANVSHEFKTPLTTIRLYSELLEQGRIRDEVKRGESLRTISRETQRLARLVNNVLDFSRLEQGRKKIDLAEHDLREEIVRIVDWYAPCLAEAGLKFELVRPSTPCIVKTDLDAVEQILVNLLDNACKYAADGGEVTVSLREVETGRAPALFIVIADRGPGIPSAHREKIFEKFHRVNTTLTTSQSGAGLGLIIARQLARRLGGNLVYSPRKGGGSEFALLLPSKTQNR